MARLKPFVSLFSSQIEYENGYLVYECPDDQKDVWRLASDCAPGEVATHAPPDEEQKRAGELFSMLYHRHAPRGHFRPWARLVFPVETRAYRLVYPTLLCASSEWAFLHDVRTGALVQTIDLGLENICYVDVNERYVFVCEPEALHVYSRGDSDGGAEVLCIPLDVSFSKVVSPSTVIDSDPFVSILPLSPVNPVVNENPLEIIAGVWCPYSYQMSSLIFSVSPCIQRRSRSRDHNETKRYPFLSGL
jgi:hypothetical protein